MSDSTVWVVSMLPKRVEYEATPWLKFVGAFETLEEARKFAERLREERPQFEFFVTDIV